MAVLATKTTGPDVAEIFSNDETMYGQPTKVAAIYHRTRQCLGEV